MNTVCTSCQAINRIPEDRVQDTAKCGRCGHDLFDGEVINATGATLDKLLKDDLPVVVDFWAPWCGPCQEVLPIVEELSAELEGRVKVCKLNVDGSKEIARKFRVMTIPTVIVFKNGEKVAEKIYPKSREEILSMLEGL